MAHYESDLADIHHRDFGQYALHAAKSLMQMPLFNASSVRILDLGCGSGITAQVLSDAGHQVVGLDYSEDMLEIARRTAPKAAFVQGSVFDYKFPESEAVLAIGEVFNYLFDEKSGLEALQEVFSKIYTALEAGGVFLFDLLMCGAMEGKSPQTRIIENERWSMFIEISEDTEKETLQREIVLFIPEGELFRRSKEVHRQRLFHTTEIVAMLKQVGFAVETMTNYGELQFRQGHQGFLCRKA